jgi:hypothetical protein
MDYTIGLIIGLGIGLSLGVIIGVSNISGSTEGRKLGNNRIYSEKFLVINGLGEFDKKNGEFILNTNSLEK